MMAYYTGDDSHGNIYYVEGSSVEEATMKLADGLSSDDGFLEGEARRANLRSISLAEYNRGTELVIRGGSGYSLAPGVHVLT